jgi:hypothetical protein
MFVVAFMAHLLFELSFSVASRASGIGSGASDFKKPGNMVIDLHRLSRARSPFPRLAVFRPERAPLQHAGFLSPRHLLAICSLVG